MGSARALSLASMVRLLFTRIESGDHRQRRLRGMMQGVVTSLGNRIIGVMVTFLSVPLTIGYLGTERYGVWITLGSLLAWLQLSDSGLGMGLTNAVTTAAGQDRPDLVRTHVSNGMLLLSAIAAAIAVWHNLPSGGGKRALHDHVSGLLRRGHTIEAWCPPTADSKLLPRLPWLAPRVNATPAGLKAWFLDWRSVRNKRLQAREEVDNAAAFDRVLVNSYFSRESVLRAYGLDSDVCYLGIDTGHFVPQHLPQGDYAVGFGSITPGKNLRFCIEAVAETAASRPKLLWIGNLATQSCAAAFVSASTATAP